MMDLTTNYMGLSLKNPLIAAASPLTSTLKSIQRLEKAGIAAVVLPSLFEEQIRREQEEEERIALSRDDLFPEVTSFLPAGLTLERGSQAYLDTIHKVKAEVGIPVIASLNGCSEGGWMDYARQIEQAGADGIELHIYYNPPSLEITGRQVEDVYLDVVRSVKNSVTIPVALKIDPFFSAFGNMARQFDEIGVDALVMFNRMLQPDFNLNNMQVETSWPISKAGEIGIPLRWISVLHGKINASLAATSGAYDHEDIIKYLLGGADTVMLASALIRNGADYVSVLLKGLEVWLKQRDFVGLNDMRGLMSQCSVANPEAFERANYIRTVDGARKH
ncbi:dihydroorotate dehydrogenase-like protein [Salinisphaera sp. G21_0]|uniref:dihydroorotate dehydrogenase-like protein n=1 Tax=Salinisphaera sp. G21_0 TaxID=2821094 RepID=UPI001AD9FAD3|nr:dihydroorotate dehydrogenase-like protein [Salinisphaera sp. G21_0]MBO9482789.1 dihydroorotate dehydrogenase-like protein [Salinisphaera sp. G21_0]